MTDRSAGRCRLVVLRALKLGDFLTAVPALRAISRAYPDHERILAAPARFEELIHHTGFHRVSPTPDLVPLGADCRGPDLAVDLHGRGPQSQRLLIAVRPGRLISFHHPELSETAGLPEWRPDEHEVRRWCRMLDESGVPSDPHDLRLGPLPRLPEWDVGGATLIHPGAASEARRWPVERFADVARSEAAAGRRVVVTGTAAEIGRASEVARRAGLPAEAVKAGQSSLTQLAVMVSTARAVVSGDTGVAHMATATATPSVVLFGPVPPAEWGPPAGGTHLALWAGRRGDPHGAQVDPGLLAISVADVLAALDRLPG